MKVSVIIPCYNGRQYLKEAIESALNQSYQETELIVINDGSTDDSQLIISSYREIKSIEQKNSGVARARNRGVSVAAGEFIVFLDQDDRLKRDAISLGLAAFGRHPDALMVYGSNEVIDEGGGIIFRNVQVQRSICYSEVLFGTVPAPSQCMFKREALLLDGGLKSYSHGGDDFELYLRLAQRVPIFCHAEMVAEYRNHRGQVSRSPSKVLRVFLGILADQEHAGRGKGQGADFMAARRYWKRYFGQFIPTEALRRLGSRDWAGFVDAVSAFLGALPQSLGGFGRFLWSKVAPL